MLYDIIMLTVSLKQQTKFLTFLCGETSQNKVEKATFVTLLLHLSSCVSFETPGLHGHKSYRYSSHHLKLAACVSLTYISLTYFTNLQGSHETASCLQSVMTVVPGRLCLNIYATVETVALLLIFHTAHVLVHTRALCLKWT